MALLDLLPKSRPSCSLHWALSTASAPLPITESRTLTPRTRQALVIHNAARWALATFCSQSCHHLCSWMMEWELLGG